GTFEFSLIAQRLRYFKVRLFVLIVDGQRLAEPVNGQVVTVVCQLQVAHLGYGEKRARIELIRAPQQGDGLGAVPAFADDPGRASPRFRAKPTGRAGRTSAPAGRTFSSCSRAPWARAKSCVAYSSPNSRRPSSLESPSAPACPRCTSAAANRSRCRSTCARR